MDPWFFRPAGAGLAMLAMLASVAASVAASAASSYAPVELCFDVVDATAWSCCDTKKYGPGGGFGEEMAHWAQILNGIYVESMNLCL